MLLGQGFNELIIAPATPSGTSAIAVLRISGGGAHALLKKLFVPKRAKILKPWKMYLGDIIDPDDGHPIDQVLSVLMPGPHTYTGEELAEIHCHGNPRVVEAIMAVAIKHGARLARPGEFSERAFLQGKMDLLQVEALSQLLSNEITATQPNFLREVKGQLGTTLQKFENALIPLQATLQASLDYPEDVAVPKKEPIKDLLKELSAICDDLLEDHERAAKLSRGLKVVLVGAPNAGKSTLINSLVKNDRLLVSEIAGTTRDYVEVPFVVNGYQLFLVDTAGLGESRDALDAASQKRSLNQLEGADLILYLHDGTSAVDDGIILPENIPVIKLVTKADLPGFVSPGADVIPISAHNGQGMEILLGRLDSFVSQLAPKVTQAGVLTSARQSSLVSEMRAECFMALDALDMPEWPMLVSDELSHLEKLLAELTGKSISEEVLSEIFSHFCLGK